MYFIAFLIGHLSSASVNVGTVVGTVVGVSILLVLIVAVIILLFGKLIK